MGRINLKSAKFSVKKYRYKLVRTSFPDDCYSLYFHGRIIASGPFEVVSSIRDKFEFPSEPVQLEFHFIDDPLLVCTVEPDFNNLGLDPIHV